VTSNRLHDQCRITGAADSAVVHDVRFVKMHMLQNFAAVRNDQPCPALYGMRFVLRE
jgi:hypothetical protein